jgi:hypothetical protein
MHKLGLQLVSACLKRLYVAYHPFQKSGSVNASIMRYKVAQLHEPVRDAAAAAWQEG